MCDMDMSSDCNSGLDIGSDIGSGFESDISLDNGFETLESVDDSTIETMEMTSDNYTECAGDIEMLDLPNDYYEDSVTEFSETESMIDLGSLEGIEESMGEQLELNEAENEGILGFSELEETDYQENLETQTSEEISELELPIVLTEDEIEDYIETATNPEHLRTLHDSLLYGDVVVDTNDNVDEYSNLDLFADEQAEPFERIESDEFDIEQPIDPMDINSQDMQVNYEDIYADIQREALEAGFDDIQIDADPERLESSLEGFQSNIWDNMTLAEQKDSMENLADYVGDIIDLKNPPAMDYYYNETEGHFGGYDPNTNTLHVNEYMLYNSNEAADTIAHELWHAHQHECATDPKTALDYQYQYNWENYIPPELGGAAYSNQLLEAEARAFASQFKERIGDRK